MSDGLALALPDGPLPRKPYCARLDTRATALDIQINGSTTANAIVVDGARRWTAA